MTAPRKNTWCCLLFPTESAGAAEERTSFETPLAKQGAPIILCALCACCAPLPFSMEVYEDRKKDRPWAVLFYLLGKLLVFCLELL